MIKYFVNFFFLLSISIVFIDRLWGGNLGGYGVGVCMVLAIASCIAAATLHFYALLQDRSLSAEVAHKKDAAIQSAVGIYFKNLYLIPHFFLGSYSEVAWSLFLKSSRRRYWDLIVARLAFPNLVLSLTLYFVVWVAAVEGYRGGLASSHVIAKFSNQIILELVFVFVCSWLAAMFLFHAITRAFLRIQKGGK